VFLSHLRGALDVRMYVIPITDAKSEFYVVILSQQLFVYQCPTQTCEIKQDEKYELQRHAASEIHNLSIQTSCNLFVVHVLL